MPITAGDICVGIDATHIETSSTLIKSYRQVFSFTDAQIKASPTTPLTLVSAPGANKLIVFQGADIVTNFAAAYTNIYAEGHCAVAYNTSPTIYPAVDIRNDTGLGLTWHTRFFEQAGAVTPLFWQLQPNFGQWEVTYGSAFTFGDYDTSLIYNKALIFKVANNASNFTGGNAANTIKIAVKWDVWDLS